MDERATIYADLQRQLASEYESSCASAAVLFDMLDVFYGIEPKSVVDVGCGLGPFVETARTRYNLADANCVGVDGPWQSKYRQHDLTQPLDIGRKFSVVLCLEVAEHLPSDSARTLVQSLVRQCYIDGRIVFSAAIPGQGGHGHVNEQWPQYWLDLFHAEGYSLQHEGDRIRREMFAHMDVLPWLAQNVLVLDRGTPCFDAAPRVHPRVWLRACDIMRGLRAETEQLAPLFSKDGLIRVKRQPDGSSHVTWETGERASGQ